MTHSQDGNLSVFSCIKRMYVRTFVLLTLFEKGMMIAIEMKMKVYNKTSNKQRKNITGEMYLSIVKTRRKTLRC